MHFTGREKLVAAVHDELFKTTGKKRNHRLALHGLGGVGKTQVALEYAYSRRNEYESVYWITAVNQMTLFSGFQEVAKQAHCVVEYAKLKPADVTLEVLAWMNRHSNWLLVLDNLDDLSVIDSYLNAVSIGDILITTRDQHYVEIPAEGLETSSLEIEDAIELLLLRSSITGPIPR
jgi:predicted ATPase